MRIWIDVLGCPKNEADSDALKAILVKRGHEIVKDLDDADVAIINTCAFVSDAKRESVDEILEVVNYKDQRDIKVIVHGCLTQRYFKEIRKEIGEIDAVLGVVPPLKVAQAVENLEDFKDSPQPIYEFLGRTIDEKPYAYVKIGDGCDRKCAFCAIPSIKGPLKNRGYDDILEEIRFLVQNGKKEIILVSQDSTSYAYNGKNFMDLLRSIDSIEGEFWIRLLYLYPDGIDEDLVMTVANSKKILHYFDMPLQHASPKILRLMRRNPDLESIKRKISFIRSEIPDAIFRTSFIVGFPQEEESDFEDLLRFIDEMKFDRVGAFIYSDEEGTESYNLDQKVKRSVARLRFNKLLERQQRISLERNKKLVGMNFKTLVEGFENGMYFGRTYMDAPEIDGLVYISSSKPVKIGTFVDVKIKSFEFYDLEGELK
ncbi:30S ribosomal protein S12 methylthiotransferase RimO [Athalassotoga saccharophila]|uniref:30S ribosomal protein S12 methylthiotransferase RimO n=1 Tax=Athalassotoga saccharophila TaxID=1441386 RepID=UPI00137A696E|nr:30S ribosomal protein S12 methylthiotransferase RimO [Athalassotoga saccharophila]BBJ27518.1 ribosomal protein S12 methylthiotransferase RimO [Athalassotoga saccharophila]